MIDGDIFSGMNLPGVLEDYTVLEELGFLFLRPDSEKLDFPFLTPEITYLLVDRCVSWEL